jgi:hypothetical protein
MTNRDVVMSPVIDPVSWTSSFHSAVMFPGQDVAMDSAFGGDNQRVLPDGDVTFDLPCDRRVLRADDVALDQDGSADPRDDAALVR